MAKTPTCFRCNDDIPRPVQEHANYVHATDTVESEQREVVYGLQHSELSLRRLDFLDRQLDRDRAAISAEISMPNAPDRVTVSKGSKIVQNPDGSQVETADEREIGFSVPQDQFTEVPLDSPEEVHGREDLARAFGRVEEVEVQKTGLVCPDCSKDTDNVIWGPAAE